MPRALHLGELAKPQALTERGKPIKSIQRTPANRNPVFNYLHLSCDSLYKTSIDKSPIYSIINPTNAQMGKSSRQTVFCTGCEVLPEQPAQGLLPVKQCRLQPLACRGLLEPHERVRKMPHQREWYRRELVFQGLCLLILQGTRTFSFKESPA